MRRTITLKLLASPYKGTGTETIFDTAVSGLALRSGPRGRVWYFTYRFDGGPTRWLKLGPFPAISLDEARRLAGIERHVLDVEQQDPIEQRRLAAEAAAKAAEPVPATPKAFTFGDFVPVYLATQKGRKKTWHDDENAITKHLLPAWRDLPLKDIGRTRVHELLDGLVGQGLTVGVNRIQALISGMFTIALDRGLIEAHPVARMIKRFEETPRSTTLTDDQIRALWNGLDATPGMAADVMKLRLALGQRAAQTASMRRAEIDLAAATWTKPRREMKHKKGTRPHVVALPPLALAIIRRRIAALPENEPRVFPGYTLSSLDAKALAPLHGGQYSWIDLRRTTSTRLSELGFGNDVIDRLLDHARATVTEKHYNQNPYELEIRAALTAWNDEIARVLAKRPKRATKVLRMRTR